MYLAVKPINQNVNPLESSKRDPRNYELTLEKKSSDDGYFILQNRESHAQHEEGNYLKSDAFFGLYHFKTSKLFIIKQLFKMIRIYIGN